MTRLTRFALNNPAITYLVMIVLLLGGLGAALSMKEELIPEVKFPLATVITVWPGASADEVTRSVVTPIEKAMDGLENIDVVEVSSRASDSFGAVTVRAEYGTNPTALRDAIDTALADVDLPEDAEAPEVVAFDFGDLPIVQASVSGNLDQAQLQRVVNDDVVPELETIDGVSQVSLAGDRADRLVIRLDPAKMAEKGVTAAQIQGILAANNLAIPAGSLEADGKTVPLLVGNRIRTPDDIRELALVGGAAGGPTGSAAAAGAPAAPVAPSSSITASEAAGAPATEANRTRLVLVAAGDTVDSLARRFGSEPEAILAANGLTSDVLTPGTALRIPVSTAGELPEAWRELGARQPADVTPAMVRELLVRNPQAITDLSTDQLLALPDATVAALPMPFILRQPESVRAALLARRAAGEGATGSPATATPASTGLAPLAGPRLAAPLRQPELVRLGDVATVEREPEEATTINRSDLEPSIGLLIAKERSANTVSVVKAIEDKLDQLEEDLKDDGVIFNVAFEQASFIESSLNSVSREGILGAILAILVILVFLRSVRSTIVAAVSIPTSVLIAFLLMQIQGLTLNLLTLSALTVAIGRVVDDSIVVLENIYRHIQRGEDRWDAVFNGTREVSKAITTSTLVTVAVFLPLGFIGGITSQFFLPFALTVTWALLASLLVAVTIVPLLAKGLLSKDKLPEERETALQRMYTPALEWALDHRPLALLGALLFFVASLLLVPFIPKTFLPSFGEKNIQVDLALPPGTGLAETDALSQKVEEAVKADRAIERVEATVGRAATGFSFGNNASGGDSAQAYMLATFAEDSTEDQAEVVKRLRRTVTDAIAGTAVTSTVRLSTGGGPEGSVYDLQVRADDEAQLRDANARILAALRDDKKWKDEGYEDVPIENLTSNLSAARPVLAVDVDPAKAIARGLTAAQVALAVRQVVDGQDLGDIELEQDGQTETVKAVILYPKDTIRSVAGLRDFSLASPGGPVRLSDVATVTERPGPVQVTRVDGERAALLSGEITEADTFGVIAAAKRIIDDLELDEAVEVGAGVESAQQQNGFSDMLRALPISILIVYLLMVVAFGSLVHPFTILFSVPFAISGALMALAVTGRPLGLSSLIGIMMLIGIVVTNAVVLVDLVQQYRDSGLDARTALIRGGRTRLRPILMTALATIIALIPLALGIGGGESLIADELATVVIGGLLVSTVLTLIIVPVIYSYLDGLSRRKEATPATPEPPPPLVEGADAPGLA